MAGTININQLLTEDILLSDFLVKADENGLAAKTTVQELANKITTTGDVAFKGKVASTDATVGSDGWYFAEDSGTYTNNGGLVIDLSNNLAIIIVSNTQTTFSKIDIPLNIAFDNTPTLGSTNAVTSEGVKVALNLVEDSVSIRPYLFVSKSTIFTAGEVESLKVIKNIIFEYQDKTNVDRVYSILSFSNNFGTVGFENYISLKSEGLGNNISKNFSAQELTDGYAEIIGTGDNVGVTAKVWFDYSLTDSEGLLISSSASEHNLLIKNGRYIGFDSSLATETQNRESADTLLQGDINTEIQDRENAIDLVKDSVSIRPYLFVPKSSTFTTNDLEVLKVVKDVEFAMDSDAKLELTPYIIAFSNNYATVGYENYIALKIEGFSSTMNTNFTTQELADGYAEIIGTSDYVGITAKVWFDYSQTSSEGLLISSGASIHNLIIKNNKLSNIKTAITDIRKTNHWFGKKIIGVGTSVIHAENSTVSYFVDATERLGGTFVNTGVPGIAIHLIDNAGTLEPRNGKSSSFSISEYASQGITIDAAPIPYEPDGLYNKHYYTWENIFKAEHADADLWVFAVSPNNTDRGDADWNDFDKSTWTYNTGTFEDHRTTFKGALIYLLNKLYALNPSARVVFALDSTYRYEDGLVEFTEFSNEFGIPIIDMYGKLQITPLNASLYKSLGGTNDHPSTYAHELMGKVLANELLLIS